MRWDIFCRVIDNHGDLGVCWRLAADLAARGDSARLYVDDAGALAWMAPLGAPGVAVHRWDEALAAAPQEAVIEAFGCDLPAPYVERMAQRRPPPAWINLEYLSAEAYVERSHRLPSPQLAGPGRGLSKVFFYPGFTARTGGLIREPWLDAELPAFDPAAWRATQGIDTRAGERVVSLFCYDNPALPALIAALADTPTLLLVTHGEAARQVRALLGDPARAPGALRVHYLPALTQRGYDRLLWSCDLNFVRGEDSFVRAQWAGRPFVWQIYPQHDGVHAAKLAAFEARFLAEADPALAAAMRALSARWNGLDLTEPAGEPAAAARGDAAATAAALRLPPAEAWQAHCVRWRTHLWTLPDLTSGLQALAGEAR
jgi:uncharacterized repeat protein (TIGR03837 family)